ncbi:LOW QUALITY PROTEIN: uncharacterized protein LOC132084059 [Ammospiza nelsoni]|uniref:LOW QUALITY PROTEIN: uncharacterized protein LOC132084059 n=1 Tax=Ammospiza nelsoni TaxID=2857394 RepID=UPI00286A9DB0|nr:LOW QUALITY PROTEIN: uncharacterized protein LOC132084059 [Ammospiza nelsoni]
MRRARAAGLQALVAVLIVAASRAQVQQEPFLETTEGNGINITCSHPKIQPTDWIQWYRQLPGQGPELLALTLKDTKELPGSAGQLSVSADRRSSWLWLAEPRRGDAAVYYCALGARAEEPGLRPGTNRRGRAPLVPGCRAGAATGTDTGTTTDTGNGNGNGADSSTDTSIGNGHCYRSRNGPGTDTMDTTTVIDPSGASRGLSFVSDKKGQEEREDNGAMGLSNTHQDLEISSDPTELRTPQDGEKPQQGRNP